MSRQYPIPITAGSKLLTQPTWSLENIGDANFSLKVNFRRSKDQEIRREGWAKFQPYTGQPLNPQYIFDGTYLLNRLIELVKPNGERIVVGAANGVIKYFSTSTFSWVTIGTGFTPGVRWQAVIVAGVLVLNDVVDLPVYYRVDDSAVTVMKELRLVGVASVGRIAEYNGFLFLGDVTEIKADQLDKWMNGYANYTSVGNSAKNANFNVAFVDFQKTYQVTTGAGTITATLPAATLSNFPFYVWITKVDAGAGKVVTSPLVADELISLVNINDSALLWWNGTTWVAKYFPGGVISGYNPYGAPPTDIVQEFPDEEAWSDFGDATNWAPLFTAVQPAASVTIYLPSPPDTWIAGQTRVAVINGGPNNGTLGGDSLHPDGILVTAIGAFDPAHDGVPITLEITTDATIGYPRVVNVTRWTDVSTLVGKQSLGNGSKIIAMGSLQGQLIAYQQDGYAFVTRFTGVATSPFTVREKYKGPNVPMFGDCLIAVNGDYHLYPAKGNRFYGFDGVTEPQIHAICDNARDIFFTGMLPTYSPFALDNPMTKEIWFSAPELGLVFAYDYEQGTASKIDSRVDAGCVTRQPGGTNDWFILGIQGNVYQYGLLNGVGFTWLRDGVAAVPRIASGLITMADAMNEKTLLSYTPVLSSPSPDIQFTVDLLGTYNPSVAPASFLGTPVALPDPAGSNFLTTMFQAIYLQDIITVTDVRDLECRLSARLFEYDKVIAGGVTRTSP